MLAALSTVAVGVVLARHWSTVHTGSAGLRRADPGWLLVAAGCTGLTWVASTLVRLGATAIRPPVARLFAVQVAASFANHVLPAGCGALAVNVRFLQRHGASRGSALGAAALTSAADLVTHLVLLVTVLAAAPSALVRVAGNGPAGDLQRGSAGGVSSLASLPTSATLSAEPAPGPLGGPLDVTLLAIMGVVGVTGITLAVIRPAWLASARGAATGRCAAVAGRIAAVRRRSGAGRAVARIAAGGRSAGSALTAELAGLAAVLRDPGRAAMLWVGSVALPLLHCVTLLAALRSLGIGLPVLTVAAVYLAASAVSTLVPAPGGFGGLDVALVGGLVEVGQPAAAAVGAVLAYRLITVWLPLVPAGCLLALLIRLRVI